VFLGKGIHYKNTAHSKIKKRRKLVFWYYNEQSNTLFGMVLDIITAKIN
jgi:hypothetical protein